MQGLLDVGAAVATMFPGVGTAIAVALDVLNASIDVSNAREPSGGLSGIVNKLQTWVMDNARNIPIIGPMVRIGEAFGYLAEGDVKSFFKGMMGAGLANVPGLGMVYDWLFGSTDPDVQGTEAAQPTGFTKIKDAMKNLYKTISDALGGVLDKAIQTAVALIYKVTPAPDWLVTKGLRKLGVSEKYLKLDEDERASSDAVANADKSPTVRKAIRSSNTNRSEADFIDALNRNTEAMQTNAEATMVGNATAVANTNNSSQINNFNHTNTGGSGFRNKARGYGGYGMMGGF